MGNVQDLLVFVFLEAWKQSPVQSHQRRRHHHPLPPHLLFSLMLRVGRRQWVLRRMMRSKPGWFVETFQEGVDHGGLGTAIHRPNRHRRSPPQKPLG